MSPTRPEKRIRICQSKTKLMSGILSTDGVSILTRYLVALTAAIASTAASLLNISTYSNFLTASPFRDIYGIVETPDTAGLVNPGDSAVVGTAFNERSRGGTP